MTVEPSESSVVDDLDVRGMRKPEKHPAIFAAFSALPVGGAFVLINDHDPRHLHDEFDVEHPRGYDWEYLNREPRDWRIKITKLASTALPRVLVDAAAITVDTTEPDVSGAIWKLQVGERDLDSNIIALPPGRSIDAHAGPDLDVLIYILAGGGQLETEIGAAQLTPGKLLWLPRRSRRRFVAGEEGLRYLTVHQRRQALVLQPFTQS